MMGAEAVGGWDLPEPFLVPIRVEADAIDEFNHVNNAIYVSWLQQAARAHASSIGLDFDLYRRLDRGMVVRQHRVDYLKPALMGDRLQLATWVVDCDERLRVQRRFQLCRAGETLLRAQTQFVCVALSSGRARRMPEPFVQAYRSVLRQGR